MSNAYLTMYARQGKIESSLRAKERVEDGEESISENPEKGLG